MDKETIQILLDLLNPLHGELDRQTYDEKVKENFDGSRDREYNVDITAQMERDLTQAVCILEDRKRQRDNIPWREDDWQARDMRLRGRLDVASQYLLSKQSEPKAVEALAAVLFVQSCLKLDREADALARAEEAASARKREAFDTLPDDYEAPH